LQQNTNRYCTQKAMANDSICAAIILETEKLCAAFVTAWRNSCAQNPDIFNNTPNRNREWITKYSRNTTDWQTCSQTVNKSVQSLHLGAKIVIDKEQRRNKKIRKVIWIIHRVRQGCSLYPHFLIACITMLDGKIN
jgi:hypothetical protein